MLGYWKVATWLQAVHGQATVMVFPISQSFLKSEGGVIQNGYQSLPELKAAKTRARVLSTKLREG